MWDGTGADFRTSSSEGRLSENLEEVLSPSPKGVPLIALRAYLGQPTEKSSQPRRVSGKIHTQKSGSWTNWGLGQKHELNQDEF
jgi:hypothetical protein